jgi:hypothetical protein
MKWLWLSWVERSGINCAGETIFPTIGIRTPHKLHIEYSKLFEEMILLKDFWRGVRIEIVAKFRGEQSDP